MRSVIGEPQPLSARLLIEIGIDPKIAISKVRAVRPGAIETVEQEKYVLGHTSCRRVTHGENYELV